MARGRKELLWRSVEHLFYSEPMAEYATLALLALCGGCKTLSVMERSFDSILLSATPCRGSSSTPQNWVSLLNRFTDSVGVGHPSGYCPSRPQRRSCAVSIVSIYVREGADVCTHPTMKFLWDAEVFPCLWKSFICRLLFDSVLGSPLFSPSPSGSAASNWGWTVKIVYHTCADCGPLLIHWSKCKLAVPQQLYYNNFI